ncbi:MAG: fatty acid desaturase [Lentisphaerae bacterium]|nr:fatty acid desaturase [Lentisphaerota bacterium]
MSDPADRANATHQPWDAKIDWYRSKIDKDELRKLTERSDVAGFLQMGTHLLLVVGTGALAYYAWYHFPWPLTVLAFLTYGTVYSFLGVGCAGHELSHGTVFKTRFWNEFFIHLTGFLTRGNFHHFRASHAKHHQLTVHTDRDLEVVLPQRIRRRDWFTICTFGFTAPLVIFGTLIRHSAGRLEGEWEHRIFPDSAPRKRQQMINWARIVLAGHVIMAALFIGFGLWPLLLLITFPHYGGLLVTLCGSTQHMGLPSNEPDFRLSCRTVILNPVFRFLYWHMNYHVEHHMYAGVPFYKLGRLRRLIESDLPAADNGLIVAWRHIFEIFRKQEQDPSYAYHATLPQSSQPEG